jgi:PAS domain S-box-containing protein
MNAPLQLGDFSAGGGLLLDEALGAAGVGVCHLDAQGRLERVSAHAAQLLGTTQVAALGQPLSGLVREDDAMPARLWPCGSEAWLPLRLVHVSPTLALLARDADYDGLLRQLQLHHAALEAAANAIVITNAHGLMEYVNPAFTRMTGYAAREALGQHTRLLSSGQQDKAYYEVLWATLRAGETWSGVFINRRKDGTLYTEESTITPVSAPDGAVHFIAVKRDVTVERRLEAQAARSERLGLLGELAASVAHDLANLLSPLVAGVAFLQSGEASAAERAEVVEDMAASTRRALGLSKQLVDFARGGQGLRSPVKTSALLRSYAEQLARLVPPGVAFSAAVPEGLPTLVVDSLQLYQVLQNLCGNAVDAMPNGGVLTVAARVAEGGLELEVRDSGAGIRPEVLPHLFEPFFTTKPAGRGTGLGLATVKRIAQAHGGGVRVESAVGKGSAFVLTLPLAPV